MYPSMLHFFIMPGMKARLVAVIATMHETADVASLAIRPINRIVLDVAASTIVHTTTLLLPSIKSFDSKMPSKMTYC